ncbi:kin-29, partial [Symbiodinium sp. CCMP2456]
PVLQLSCRSGIGRGLQFSKCSKQRPEMVGRSSCFRMRSRRNFWWPRSCRFAGPVQTMRSLSRRTRKKPRCPGVMYASHNTWTRDLVSRTSASFSASSEDHLKGKIQVIVGLVMRCRHMPRRASTAWCCPTAAAEISSPGWR